MVNIGGVEAGLTKTIEQVAMDKVSNPFAEPYPFGHITDLDKLESILREGIISGDFATRIDKKNYRRMFRSSWNRKHVSLHEGGPHGIGYSDQLIILVDPLDEPIKADESHRQARDYHRPDSTEYLVKRRIAPREFKGIQIGGYRKDLSSLEKIVDIFRSLNPDNSLPIYTLSGLVWPVRMDNYELQDHVKSKI